MRIIFNVYILLILFGCLPADGFEDKASLATKATSYVWESHCNSLNEQKLTITTNYIPAEAKTVKYGLLPVQQKVAIIAVSGENLVISLPFRSHVDSIGVEEIEVLDCIITDAKCIEYGNELLYSLYGGGLIDPPHEFFGLLSSDKGWLWWYYGSQYEVYGERGNIDSLNSVYGETMLSDLTNMVSVLPH